MRYYRLITIYYGLARAAPHRVPLQGYGMHHKGSWGCGQALHTPPGWIYSPLEGLTNEDSPKVRISLKRQGCSTDNAEGSNTKSLYLFTRSSGQPLQNQPRRTRLRKEGKPPSFKGSGLQEVIPDWLMKSKKRELQSCSGMFRKRIEGG